MFLHHKARFLAKELLRNETQLLEVLLQMKKEDCFTPLGYKGVFEYVHLELKLSESQAYYYKSVVEKSCEVPRLKEAITQGELTLSQARRIVKAIDATNCEDWIQKAVTLKQKELEREVAEKNPHSRVRETLKPVGPSLIQMTVALTPEVEALLRQVKDLESQRTQKDSPWNEVLKTMAEEYLNRHDPVRRAKRVSSRKTRKTVSSAKAIPIRLGRKPIPAHIKHQVNLRDGFQCTASTPNGVRCPERRWLESDHKVLVSHGGLNLVENLRTLCSFHHKLRHRRVG